jgi:hypothetical protein
MSLGGCGTPEVEDHPDYDQQCWKALVEADPRQFVEEKQYAQRYQYGRSH